MKMKRRDRPNPDFGLRLLKLKILLILAMIMSLLIPFIGYQGHSSTPPSTDKLLIRVVIEADCLRVLIRP
jgi:hypothetical protein